MKVSVLNDANRRILARHMSVGQIGTVTEASTYEGHIVLATYNGLVSLTDPHKTWNRGVEMEVILFPVGTQIELEVE